MSVCGVFASCGQFEALGLICMSCKNEGNISFTSCKMVLDHGDSRIDGIRNPAFPTARESVTRDVTIIKGYLARFNVFV